MNFTERPAADITNAELQSTIADSLLGDQPGQELDEESGPSEYYDAAGTPKEWGLVQDIRTQLFDPADSNLVLAIPAQAQPSTGPQPTVTTLPQFSYSSGSKH